MERIHRELYFFFKVKAENFLKNAKNSNFQILKKTSDATHPLMIVIICAIYKKNPSRTVDATERTRFSKSRPNDLEDIVQGYRSWCTTHSLMVVIICAWYGKNPSRTVDVTERTQHAGRTDGQTDGRVDGVKPVYHPPPPTTSLCGGYKYGKRG